MLVAGIDVSLGPHLAHAVKVVDVDVDEHSEQTRQNLLSHLHEGLREGSTCESDRWEKTGEDGRRRRSILVTFYSLHHRKQHI